MKHKEKRFTVEEMKSALLKIRGVATERQMMMLESHYYERRISTGKLSLIAGYRGGYRIANIQYGIFCRRLANELGFVSPSDQIYTIAKPYEKDEHGHFQWEMDPVVIKALRELAWFDSASKPADCISKE